MIPDSNAVDGTSESSCVLIRRQLTLFVPERSSNRIEAVRRVVDPVQFALIPAHVTLCREEELESFVGWPKRLQSMVFALTLQFGRAVPFSGHGIMLPCIDGVDQFRNLRQAVLGSDSIREHQPHLTLAHPRNPKASGNTIEAALQLPLSFEITFDTIRLIEQTGSGQWKTLESFPPDHSARLAER
jgi:hypothetical protein